MMSPSRVAAFVIAIVLGGGEARSSAQRRTAAAATAAATLAATPVETFLPATHRYVARVDFRSLRASPLAADLRAFLRALPAWRSFGETAGIEPLDAVDVIALSTRGRDDATWRAVIVHTLGEAAMRAAVGRVAAHEGLGASWNADPSGLNTLPWSAPGAPFAIVELGTRGILLLPESDVPGVAATATRIARGEVPLESAASAHALSVEGRPTPENERAPFTPRSSQFDADVDQRGVHVTWHGMYETPDLAEAARAHWDAERQEYARNTLLSLVGATRPIREAQFARTNERLELAISLTLDEARLILDFITPIAAGGRRGPESRPPQRGATSAPRTPPPPPR